MTISGAFKKLQREGTAIRIARNQYQVGQTSRARFVCPDARGQIHSAQWFYTTFFIFDSPDSVRLRISAPRSQDDSILWASEQVQSAPTQILRTLPRDSYHSNGAGTCRRGIQQAINAVQLDADGVRRTFGLEWEINALTSEQEDKLARLLDTLPEHFTERDGSLSSTGVEIIFLPVGEQKIIEVWNTLKRFCSENHIDMYDTGAHLTYGVSNSVSTIRDLQIRLNRIALAIKACSTQRAIKRVFGRDFTDYARLPNSTTVQTHTNAWSASRGSSAYELRLCHWQGDIQSIVNIMKSTEFVFHRPFTANDFMSLFRAMGSDVSEE